MPVSGEITVPAKCWFVWPDLGIQGHGNIPQPMINEALMEVAMVHEEQFIGIAFQSWFGRRQVFS
jgi:hypothetical protein